MKKWKGWISLTVCLLFFTINVAWAGLKAKFPFTANAVEVKTSTDATVSGPDGWYTWVDTDGVLQGTSAQASPSARIEADGLLCEGMAVNLLAESTDFSEFTAEDDIAAAANVTGPEGGANTAYTLTDNGGNANDWLYYSVGDDLEADAQYTMSVYVKEGTATSFSILLHNETDSTNDILIDYQWSSNVLSEKAADAGTSTVTQLGSTSWWRITATGAASVIDNGDTYHFCLAASEAGSDPGASKTVVFYGAQLEKSPYVTSYIPTSGATAVRWSQEGAVDTTDLLGTTNTTSFKLSAASGNSFFQSDDITLTDYAGVLGADVVNAGTRNGDFEDNDSWSDFNLEGGDVAEQSTTKVWEGSYSWHVDVDGVNEGFRDSTHQTLVSGTTYRITFMYYIVSGAIRCTTALGTAFDFSVTDNTTGSWQLGVAEDVATGTSDRIKFVSYLGAAEFYIDDVRISPITTEAPAYRITLTDDDDDYVSFYIGYPDVAKTVGVNVITDQNNSDFSDGDIGDWTLVDDCTDSTVTYSAADLDGADDKQALITCDETTDACGYVYAKLSTPNIKLVSGTMYDISVNFYVPAGNTLKNVQIRNNVIDAYPVGEFTTASLGDDAYESVSIENTRIGDDSVGAINCAFYGNPADGDLCYFDDVIFLPQRHGGTDAVRLYTSSALTTEGRADEGGDGDGEFDWEDDEYDVTIEFIDVNGIYWGHASLWATDWATDMNPEGTLSLEWTPGLDKADDDITTGIIGLRNSTGSLLYTSNSGRLRVYDNTNVVEWNLDFVKNTTYDIITTWDADIDAQGDLEIYIDGTASGDLEEYDGDFTTTTNLIIGFDNPYPFHIKNLKFYDQYSSNGGLPGGLLKYYWIFDWPLH